MTSTPRFKGIAIEFADGTTYVVPPMNLATIEVLQERLATFTGGVDKNSISLVVDATLASLQRNYPDMTRERVVNELLDVSNMEEVMAAVMDVSGLRRKGQEQGEAPKPTEN